MITRPGKFPPFRLIGCFLLLLAAVSVASRPARADATETDYKPLFDGKTLKGWTYLGKPGGEYFVRNGVIICPEVSKGNLVTDAEYGDFSLRLEYKFESNGNNGVAIRAPMSTENLTYVGVEIQMLDDTAPMHRNLKPWQYNGSVYGLVAATNGTAMIGEWNTEEIECIGRNYRITLNGREIVHTDLNEVTNLETLQAHPGMFRLRGHLGFLGHDSHFEFRNIRIRELNKSQRDNKPPVGFSGFFNGHEMLLDSNTHHLAAIARFTNFEYLVNWKIEPGSSGTVLLRDCAPVSIGSIKSTNDISGVGCSGALFGKEGHWELPLLKAEKTPGEWNQFRIIVLGNTAHVFLNEELVQNNARLENFKDWEKPVYGSGQIHFFRQAGTLWFKNIYIREIK